VADLESAIKNIRVQQKVFEPLSTLRKKSRENTDMQQMENFTPKLTARRLQPLSKKVKIKPLIVV
jgi:hypothetical protein